VDRQEHDLRQTEATYRALFENAGTANCETNVTTGRLLKVNDRMCEMFGYSREELLTKTLADLTHPDDRPASFDLLESATKGENDTFTLDKRYVRKDGSTFWALKTTRVIRDPSGAPVQSMTVIQDISDRKSGEQARAALLRELAHRVRNTVQLMASLADQTAKSAQDVESYRHNFQNRLRALKAAQDLLFDADWQNVSLDQLAIRTLAPFQGEHRESIRIKLPAVALPTQHAQTLAIAFHELAANAVQHGALSRPGGRVELEGHIEPGRAGSGGRDMLVMRWTEIGGPAIGRPQRRGFGRVMLERILAAQYSGETQLDWAPSGLTFSTRLPLPDVDRPVEAEEVL
jgi:PAS domain S-box-containing protein